MDNASDTLQVRPVAVGSGESLADLVVKVLDATHELKPLNADVGGQALAVLERLVQDRYVIYDPVLHDHCLWSRNDRHVADALRVLATAGRVILRRDSAENVTATWVKR